ncbi:unnamed protein product [Acanthocheilonema viteae]|uniref:Uncharacterized protein n=1 Tax=Acanthocheilonema viteae TaxID=6277 RepID=A0A498SII6_ACAVI|nr:unnamed protein product [Acanthocheilonema viteae]
MITSSCGNLDISRLKVSTNSEKERNDQMFDQDLDDIIRMSRESLIDSFKAMEAVIQQSQFWAILIVAAKCYGEIFANMPIGYFLLSLLFDKKIPSLFFIYVVMPLFAYLLNQKTPMSKISLAERRWLILVFSFWVGATTHFILINWDLGVFPPPPLYSPTLVALLFEVL